MNLTKLQHVAALFGWNYCKYPTGYMCKYSLFSNL